MTFTVRPAGRLTDYVDGTYATKASALRAAETFSRLRWADRVVEADGRIVARFTNGRKVRA